VKRLWPFAAAAALALSPLVFVHPVRIQGRSMEPALRDGELRWGWWSWCAGEPRRGQVWVVMGPDGEAVKRVVGLPGETLVEKEGELWLAGRVLPEPYVERGDREAGGPWDCGGGYFLAGDHRPASRDSRAWGPLPRGAFQARVIGF
jgi:signal peptidase I